MRSKRLHVAHHHAVHIDYTVRPGGQMYAGLRVVRQLDGETAFTRCRPPCPIADRRSVIQWAAELGMEWIREKS